MEIWQSELRQGFQNTQSLLSYLGFLPEETEVQALFEDPIEFPIKVPLSFAKRIQKRQRRDPLLLQIIPQVSEREVIPHFLTDAVGDHKAIKQRGFIQKYQGRVLLILTGACAVHCRYCFRRHFPYEELKIKNQDKLEILGALAKDPSIEEVIFSGGDPLLILNKNLKEWALALKQIPHIKRWRLHTRIPSVLPSRIDQGLVEALSVFAEDSRKVILVTHINHAQEINDEVRSSLAELRKGRFLLLNQAVLLKEINDEAQVLKNLSESLFAEGVLPYYLHLLDRTQGTHHFEVSEERALSIYQETSSMLPGYLVPRLVREIQGQPHKVIYGHRPDDGKALGSDPTPESLEWT